MALMRTAKARLSSNPAVRTVYERAAGWRHRDKPEFVTEVEGVPVRFATTDAHSTVWFHHRLPPGGVHEPPVTKAVVDAARSAAAFADVGSHLGWFSCVVGATNRDCRVVAFEMNQALVPIIRRNLDLNGRQDAELVASAVGRHGATARYDTGSRSPGLQARFEPDADAGTPVVALDEYFATGEPPGVVKIDVEGAEHEVLRGAAALLAERRPTLFLEVHPVDLPGFGSSIAEVLALLSDAGYRLERFATHRAEQEQLQPVTGPADVPDNAMLRCTPR